MVVDVAAEQAFQQRWSAKYLVTEVRGQAVCLVCKEQIAEFKKYSLNRHYETKQVEKTQNVTDAEMKLC